MLRSREIHPYHDEYRGAKLGENIARAPMHYKIAGLSLNIQHPDLFLKKAKKVVRVGNEIEFEQEDIPEELEVWFFSL